MHYWGDNWSYWDDLDKALDYMEKEFRKYRICVQQFKTKFGTIRIYCSLGWYSLHDVTHPGYVRYMYPKWLVHLDIYFFPKIFKFINLFVLPFHKWIYVRTYKRAVEMFPHLKEEICCCADFVELLTFYKSPWKKIK